jgi:uncharacterized protein (DUF1697 family)
MRTYIALFRGINVGGHNILPMKELVELLDELGYKNVKTYIQSGNVVFQCDESTKAAISEQISSAVLQRFGFEARILLLDNLELNKALSGNPFPTENGKALHFYFLEHVPSKPDLQKMQSLQAASEQFKLEGKVFYLYAPDGIGRSKLAAQVEKCLGVPATARNWNTVGKLVDLSSV